MFEGMIIGETEDVDRFEGDNKKTLQENYNVVRSQTYLFEILPKDTSKASPLEKLATDLG